MIKGKLKIKDILGTLLFVFLLIINISILYQKLILDKTPSIFGCSFAVVLTGSMENSINIDDMVITRKQSDYNVGDVITFNSETLDNTVTHRIIDIVKDGTDDAFVTKGDANNTNDKELVHTDDVVGKVVKIVPNVGETIRYIKHPEGIAAIAMVFFIISKLMEMLVEELRNVLGNLKHRKKV